MKLSLMFGVFLCLVALSSLEAADIRYVNSPTIDLNMRQGPGTEYAVLARLPHGTAVVLKERLGLWYRVTPLDSKLEGWVLHSYLTMKPPTTADTPAEMSPQEEKERFDRLRRKGVIRIYTTTAQVLRVMIDPLIWQRLTAPQQANFLQRAQRLYGNTVVEMHNMNNDALLNRLTVTGDTFLIEGPEELPAPSGTIVERPYPTLTIPPAPNQRR